MLSHIGHNTKKVMQAMEDRAILGIVLFENQKFDSMFSDGPQDSDTDIRACKVLKP